MKTKRSVLLLIAGILGLVYTIYMIIYFSGSMFGSENAADAIGGAIATTLVTPHLIFVTLAVIFNIYAYFSNKPWAALTAGILYSVGGLLFLLYFIFVLPSLILCFIGFSRIKKPHYIKSS